MIEEHESQSDVDICQCRPEREHRDYSRPAAYMHEAGCPAAEEQ